MASVAVVSGGVGGLVWTSAKNGGAIYAGPGTGPVDVTGCVFGSNNATGNGGAIYDIGASQLAITSTSFQANWTTGGEGVLLERIRQ